MNLRELSKTDFARAEPNTYEQVNAGSLQRIADAVEKMAVNHITLQQDRDRYKRWYEEAIAALEQRNRSNAALRGQITKLKRL